MDKLEYIRFLNGDIVYIHGSVRVISSCDGYYATYYDEDETLQEVNVNVIEGIPLTPEILEKNWWYGATHSKLSDDNTKILYKTFKRKGYPTIKVSQDLKITCELSPFIVKLESVSDLQHLLFGLGINHEMEV